MINTNAVGKTALLCRYAVCIALLVVCAQIMITLPFTPVPVTLAFFMVFVIGGLLGPYHGTLCILVYILMGLIGIPVFAGFNSMSALVGPTGGYIIGYLPMTAIVGLFYKKTKKVYWRIPGMILGASVCYMFGALWYAFSAGVSIGQSLMVTAVPFIVADTFKMLVAYMVLRRLERAFAI